MKKNKKVIIMLTAVTCCTVAFSGCGKESNIVTNNVAVDETTIVETELTTEVEMVKLENIAQLISFYETDPNYNPETMVYDIYLQKVKVYGSDETQLVVAGRSMNTENGKTQETTIAAMKDFTDEFRPNGPMFAAKEAWYKDGVPYSAESIIKAALKESQCSEDDLKLYDRKILVSTFSE